MSATEAGLLATIAACLWVAGDTARATSARRRRVPIVLLALGVAIWAAGELAVWRVATPEGVRLARAFLYAGTSVIPVAWLWAAADAAQVRGLGATPLRVALLAAPLLAGYSLLWLDPAARLVHPTARPPVLGPLFLPYVAYAWLLVIAGSVGFLVSARRLGRAAPLQVAAISLGGFVPVLGNLAFVWGGAGEMDPTPIWVGVGAVAIRLFVFDAGLAAFLPVARRDVIDHLESGVLVADLHGVVVDANAAARRLVPGGRLVGRHLDEVTRAAAESPGRTIEVRTTPVRGRIGIVGAFALLIDRTESQRLERQLQLAQKLEAVGVLTAGIAHEVNNPLAFVRANLVHLQELAGRLPKAAASGQGEEVRDLLELPDVIGESLQGLDRIGRIVESLLRFARPPAESRREVSLNEVASEALRFAALHRGRTVRVDTAFDAALPLIEASEDRLVQVALNLVLNAKQALADRPDGTIRLETAREGDSVVLRVRDNGPGVPPALRERIFDPFFTTRPPGEGTGLGLAIAFDILREHDGALELDSQPGAGACFTVRLPLRRVAPAAAGGPTAPRP